MEFGMGHNNQRLLQAGFHNKLVAKLKLLDIKVTKKRVGLKSGEGGGQIEEIRYQQPWNKQCTHILPSISHTA